MAGERQIQIRKGSKKSSSTKRDNEEKKKLDLRTPGGRTLPF